MINHSSYANGPFNLLVEVAAGTSYKDVRLANGFTYYDVISTESATGSGAPSAPVSVVVAPAPATAAGLTATAGSSQITRRWNPVM